MKQYTDERRKEVSTDNVFNCKETSGYRGKIYLMITYGRREVKQ